MHWQQPHAQSLRGLTSAGILMCHYKMLSYLYFSSPSYKEREAHQRTGFMSLHPNTVHRRCTVIVLPVRDWQSLSCSKGAVPLAQLQSIRGVQAAAKSMLGLARHEVVGMGQVSKKCFKMTLASWQACNTVATAAAVRSLVTFSRCHGKWYAVHEGVPDDANVFCSATADYCRLLRPSGPH